MIPARHRSLHVVTGNLFTSAIGAHHADMKTASLGRLRNDGRFAAAAARARARFSPPFATYMAMEALATTAIGSFPARISSAGDVDYGRQRRDSRDHNARHTNRRLGPRACRSDQYRRSAVSPCRRRSRIRSQCRLNGVFQATPTWKLFGDVHYRAFDQARVDGNTTEFECEG
jgi:hypothetical protein